MKYVLLLLIRLYRLFVRPFLSRTCLFKESCSIHVERVIRESGWRQGLKSLLKRTQECREGYFLIFRDQSLILITRKGIMFPEGEINPMIVKSIADKLPGQNEVDPSHQSCSSPTRGGL